MNFNFALIFHDDSVPDGLDVWNAINSGPEIIRPTTANQYEPLKKVGEIDIEKTCRRDFVWRNGRRCTGMFQPNGWKGKAKFSLLLRYPEAEHDKHVEEVRNFLVGHFRYRLLYGASPTRELMETNLRVHQSVNCGSVPPDETILTDNRDLFAVFYVDD